MPNMHLGRIFLFSAAVAFAGENGLLVVDRGLPAANWNDASGVTARSNVRWTLYSQGFVGDDFTVGKAGERYTLNRLRVWAVPGAYESDPAFLAGC